jgi:hypothetical protein
VEFATLEWVWWFNHKRLLETPAYLPQAAFESRLLASWNTFVSEALLTSETITPRITRPLREATPSVTADD